MTSPFPDAPFPGAIASFEGADARLTVEVPHWSATVTLIDNDLKEVGGIGRVVAAEDGTGRVEVVLTPGPYEAQVTLDGRTQARWAVLRPGDATVLPASDWTELVIETAMPLAQPQPTAGADDRLARVAAMASVAAPVSAERRCEAPDARLSIFATAIRPDGGEPADFDLDIQLLDEDGAVVADLSTPAAAPRVVPRRMWRCAFDLDSGYYVLRVREGPARRLQPLYLCSGIASHVFLRCDGVARLDSLSLDMGRLGEGYDPEQDRTVAADAVLTALRTPDADRLILGSERIEDLLRAEDRNPWLAVLAAWALTTGNPPEEAGALLGELRAFLRDGPLADHPDVVALLIDERPPSVPLRYAPMLRVALQRLSAYAVDHAQAIAPGSPLDRVGTRLIADSAWTAWSEPLPSPPDAQDIRSDPPFSPPEPPGQGAVDASTGSAQRIDRTQMTPSPARHDDADPVPDTQSLPEPIRALVRAFPTSAPVYPLAAYRDEPQAAAIAEGATIAVHARLIEVAISAIPVGGRPPPARVTVSMHDGSDDLLDVDAAAVSRASGLPLDRVIRHFRRLKRAGPVEATAAIVGDLRGALGTLIAAIEAKQSDVSDAAPEPATATAIEDQVERLRSEAVRLRACADGATATISVVTDRLCDAAERLVRHAHLVIIADQDGMLRYGNRLLRDRLAIRGPTTGEALDRLRDALAAMTGASTVIAAEQLAPNSPEGQAGARIAIQRTVVVGADGLLQGHVYYLRDAAARDLRHAESLRLDTLISQVTLQVSFLEFGSQDGTDRAMERLLQLSEDVSAILA